METRRGNPMHGDFARGGETLPCDERCLVADGERTEPQRQARGLVRRGIGDQAARRVPGDRRTSPPACGTGLMSGYGRPISTDTR